MATSGKYSFTMTLSELIEGAMRLAKAIDPNETPTNPEYQTGREALNLMLLGWENEGIGLWLIKEAVIPVTSGTKYYELGPAGDAYYPGWDLNTTTSAAASSGDSQITVTSTSNIEVGERVGVVLDDTNSTVEWVTVTAVPTGSNTITFAETLSDDVLSGANVYHALPPRPLSVEDIRYVYTDGVTEVAMEMVDRKDYMDTAYKTSTGNCIQAYFDPQLTNARLYVWPTGANSTDTIKLSLRFPAQSVQELNENVEYPPQWLQAIKYNLAVELSPEFGLGVDPVVLQKAMEYKIKAQRFDQQDTPISFAPRPEMYPT